MKGTRLVLLVTLVLVTLSASAYAKPPIMTQDPEAEILYASSGTSQRCWDSMGCPMCESNIEKTMSMCVRLRYQYGFCACSHPQPITDGKTVRCTVAGYCSYTP